MYPAQRVLTLEEVAGGSDKLGRRALEALRHLAQQNNKQAQEALCRLVIASDHPLAEELTLAAQYAPQDPQQRALFFSLTGQWRQYERLDFDQTLLRTAYEAADEALRRRVTAHMLQAGRTEEWIGVVIGGPQGHRLEAMTDGEWEAVLEVLEEKRGWEELWRLAQEAPPRWGARLMQRLEEKKWVPSRETERVGFAQISRLAVQCKGEVSAMPGWRSHRTTDLASARSSCLAMSPDGKMLVSGGEKVRLWRLPDSAFIATLAGHIEEVTCLAISPDGKILASGNADGTIRLWRLPTGSPLATLAGHKRWVVCLAISPDGKILASRSDDWTMRLWRLPDGAPLTTPRAHRGGVTCLAISPDGRMLITGGWDRAVRLWHLPTGAPLATLASTGGIKCLAISPDGDILVTGGWDHTVRLWRLPTGTPLATLVGHVNEVECLAMSYDGQVLASGSLDSTVRLWRLPDGAPLATLRAGRPYGVTWLMMSPDRQVLVSKSYGGIVRVWTFDVVRLSCLPVAQLTLKDLAWAEAMLQDGKLPAAERHWLEFIVALLRWRWRFDIGVEAEPQRLRFGEFDITLEE